MEYYSIKDALSEDMHLKVKLNTDTSHEAIKDALRGKKVEDKKVHLPYHMVESLISTEYVEIDPLVGKEEEIEIEGAPEHVNLKDRMVYHLLGKLEHTAAVPEETREKILKMHTKRAVYGAQRLGETEEKGLEREEREILRKGRAGWKT